MKYDIERVKKETYVRIISDNSETRDSIAYNMLAEADIKGLIKPYFAPINGTDVYKYRVTDMTTLERYIERVEYPQLLGNILEQIINIYENLEENYLNPSGLMFSKKFIYIDEKSFELNMLYVPVENNNIKPESALKDLIIDVISSSYVIDPAVDTLIDYLTKNDVLSMIVIRSLIENLYSVEEEFVPVTEIQESKYPFISFLNSVRNIMAHKEQTNKPIPDNHHHLEPHKNTA